MEQFLKKFSNLPIEFIKDFFIIAKEDYFDNEIIIDFDIVVKWLDTRKDNLKKILIDNFENKYDYIITKKEKDIISYRGKTQYDEILITPDCFKELCMISQVNKAKEVRKYFLVLEKLIKKYNNDIKDKLYNEIGLLKNNQKPKLDIKGGVIYIIKALNSDTTLYKLGKSNDIKQRLNNYNTGKANDIEPLFIIKVNDISSVENCIKNSCKKYQYRKYKEVYEIDIQVLKELIMMCDEFTNKISIILEKDKTTKKKLSRMKKQLEKYFIYIDSN